MTVLEYFETRNRAKVMMTISGRGSVPCKPSLLFNEKGRPVGVIYQNQMIPEEHIDIQEIH